MRCDELRDHRRIVLQVGVHGDHDPAAHVLEAGRERRRLAEVAAEVDHDHVAVAVRQLVEVRARPVAAAVVDEDDLVVVERVHRTAGRADLGVQRRQRLDLVEDRHEHRELGSIGAEPKTVHRTADTGMRAGFQAPFPGTPV